MILLLWGCGVGAGCDLYDCFIWVRLFPVTALFVHSVCSVFSICCCVYLCCKKNKIQINICLKIKSLFFRGIQRNRKTSLAIINKTVARLWNKTGGTWRDKILWQRDRGRHRLHTHQGREHRWKQSGIRGDVRPVTQEEGQVTWNKRRVTFQNKTWNSHDRKPKTGQCSPRCDIAANSRPLAAATATIVSRLDHHQQQPPWPPPSSAAMIITSSRRHDLYKVQ